MGAVNAGTACAPERNAVFSSDTLRWLFPSMAAVLMMSRVTSDPQQREQILKEARNFFIKCFVEG